MIAVRFVDQLGVRMMGCDDISRIFSRSESQKNGKTNHFAGPMQSVSYDYE